MPTKKIIFLVTMLFAFAGYAQKNFTVNNNKPKAGGVISFTYVPSGSIANTLKPVEGIVYSMGSKGLFAEDIILKNEGGKYVGSVKTDTSNNFVFFGFSADKNFDNNFNDGYWVQLYDGDKLKRGSNYYLAQFYQGLGSRVGVDANTDKAIQYLETEFAQNPESRKQYILSYMGLVNASKKAEAPALIQKEIEILLKQGLKDETDYRVLSGLYTIAKLPQQAALITSLMKEKFPAGKWTINETLQQFSAEKDIVKKEQLLNQIIQKVNSDADWKTFESSLPVYKGMLIQAYANNKDWTGFKAAIAKYNIPSNQLEGIYNNLAWKMQETGDNLKLAEEFASQATIFSKNDWLKPSGPKPATLTKSQWDRSRERTYGRNADTYAMVLYKLGEFKKGFPYAKESALTIEKGEWAVNNTTYALLAEKTMSAKKYKTDLEQFVKNGKATSEIKDILKRVYAKEKRSEAGFDEYIAGLEKESYLNMIAELRK
jgi:hypothetical protein